MTEFVEGPVRSLSHWKAGHGADVTLDQDEGVKYYYHGVMNMPVGPSLRFEVKDGDGKFAGMKEIIDFQKLQVNPAQTVIEQPNLAEPQLLEENLGKRMIKMPFDEFQYMIKNKAAISECKGRGLDAAIKTYAAMNKKEIDPIAAAHEIIKVAKLYEGYLA